MSRMQSLTTILLSYGVEATPVHANTLNVDTLRDQVPFLFLSPRHFLFAHLVSESPPRLKHVDNSKYTFRDSG